MIAGSKGPKGDTGPKGEKGDKGDSGNLLWKIAEEPISALQALYSVSPTNVGVADSTVLERTHFHSISLTAALTGEPVLVQILGEIKDPFFQFHMGKTLFLGKLGTILCAPPVDALFSVQIGDSLGNGGITVRTPISVAL